MSLSEASLEMSGTVKTVPEISVASADERISFHQLYLQHESAVRHWIEKHMRHKGEVEDLVHQTFLQAWRHLPQFRGESTISTWLFQIALNEVRQYWRRQRTCQRQQQNRADAAREEPFIDRNDSPLFLLLKADTRSQLRAAIQTLPEPWQQAIRLRDLEEVPLEQAAARLGLTVSALKTRHYRARAELRRRLQKQEGMVSGTAQVRCNRK